MVKQCREQDEKKHVKKNTVDIELQKVKSIIIKKTKWSLYLKREHYKKNSEKVYKNEVG